VRLSLSLLDNEKGERERAVKKEMKWGRTERELFFAGRFDPSLKRTLRPMHASKALDCRRVCGSVLLRPIGRERERGGSGT
jgi:hypothetical protein